MFVKVSLPKELISIFYSSSIWIELVFIVINSIKHTNRYFWILKTSTSWCVFIVMYIEFICLLKNKVIWIDTGRQVELWRAILYHPKDWKIHLHLLGDWQHKIFFCEPVFVKFIWFRPKLPRKNRGMKNNFLDLVEGMICEWALVVSKVTQVASR